MNKLVEKLKKLWEKFSGLRKGLKAALILAAVCILIAIISFFVISAKGKYKVLFSGLDPADAQIVTATLKEQKIDTKVEGDTILVPKDKVDELRLDLAPELSGGSKGYELMDEGSSFGMTDEEFQIKKLRMLQGELERTIKSFSQVEEARVHITPSKDSVFVKDKEEAKAAITIKIYAGQNLSLEQVEGIVSLVSVSVPNLPKENVEVLDSNMNLLTAGLNYDEDSQGGVNSDSVTSHHSIEKNMGEQLSAEIIKLLEPVLGKNTVTAMVNVDLDFDSKQETQVIIDPNKVIVSQQTIKEQNKNGGGSLSQSPVDNNMSNTIEEDDDSSSSSRDEQKTNYESGKTEKKVISAPGEIRRLTATVFIDGVLDQAMQDTIKNAVGSAIGFDGERKDEINVVGMSFDPVQKEESQAQIDAFNKEIRAAKIKRTVINVVLILLGIGLVVLIVLLVKKKMAKKEERLLDVVISDDTEPANFAPINFEPKNEKTHVESEIKKYAQEKPDQVADIIKSWLTENER